MKLLLIPALTLPIAACNLEALEGNESPYKVAHEIRQAVIIPEAASVADVEVATMLDVVPKKQCVETFRVNRCDEHGNEIEWYYK